MDNKKILETVKTIALTQLSGALWNETLNGFDIESFVPDNEKDALRALYQDALISIDPEDFKKDMDWALFWKLTPKIDNKVLIFYVVASHIQIDYTQTDK